MSAVVSSHNPTESCRRGLKNINSEQSIDTKADERSPNNKRLKCPGLERRWLRSGSHNFLQGSWSRNCPTVCNGFLRLWLVGIRTSWTCILVQSNMSFMKRPVLVPWPLLIHLTRSTVHVLEASFTVSVTRVRLSQSIQLLDWQRHHGCDAILNSKTTDESGGIIWLPLTQ